MGAKQGQGGGRREQHHVTLGQDGKVYVWGALALRKDDQLEVDFRWQALADEAKAMGKPEPPKSQPDETEIALHDPDGSAVPLAVAGLDRVAAVAVSRDCCYALKSDGTVWAWGLNDFCTLGNSQDDTALKKSPTPVQVANLTDGSYIAASGTFALAVRGTAGETFLKWYVQFSKLLKDRLDTINRVRAEAGMIAVPLAQLRASNLKMANLLIAVRKDKGIGQERVKGLASRLAQQAPRSTNI